MDAIDAALASYGLAAVCVLMLVKAAGVPVPIPGDLILVATAGRAAAGELVLWQAFSLLLVAVIVGGAVQFAAARGPGRDLVYRLARLTGLGPDRLDKAAHALQQRGSISITLALLTPGVRNAALPACGLASLSLRTFLPALVLANFIDLTLHFALGAAGGSLLVALQPSPLVIASGLVALAIVGLVGWLVILRRRSTARVQREVLAAWQSTACPACLALGALGMSSDLTVSAVMEGGVGVQV